MGWGDAATSTASGAVGGNNYDIAELFHRVGKKVDTLCLISVVVSYKYGRKMLHVRTVSLCYFAKVVFF